MVGRSLRTAVFAAIVMVFWTLARPAHATPAPFCDDRGASALAPPPVFEAPDDAIRRAAFSSCDHDRVEFGVAVRVQHHGGAPQSDAPEMGWRRHTALAGPAEGMMLESAPVPGSPCVGVRHRVERPPRS